MARGPQRSRRNGLRLRRRAIEGRLRRASGPAAECEPRGRTVGRRARRPESARARARHEPRGDDDAGLAIRRRVAHDRHAARLVVEPRLRQSKPGRGGSRTRHQRRGRIPRGCRPLVLRRCHRGRRSAAPRAGLARRGHPGQVFRSDPTADRCVLAPAGWPRVVPAVHRAWRHARCRTSSRQLDSRRASFNRSMARGRMGYRAPLAPARIFGSCPPAPRARTDSRLVGSLAPAPRAGRVCRCRCRAPTLVLDPLGCHGVRPPRARCIPRSRHLLADRQRARHRRPHSPVRERPRRLGTWRRVDDRAAHTKRRFGLGWLLGTASHTTSTRRPENVSTPTSTSAMPSMWPPRRRCREGRGQA